MRFIRTLFRKFFALLKTTDAGLMELEITALRVGAKLCEYQPHIFTTANLHTAMSSGEGMIAGVIDRLERLGMVQSSNGRDYVVTHAGYRRLERLVTA